MSLLVYDSIAMQRQHVARRGEVIWKRGTH